MNLFLEPEDVWLFRDGRPFDAGTSHRARSLFPPFPTAMQGAVRSHQLVLLDVADLTDRKNVIDKVGTSSDYRALRMRGPFLAMHQDGQLTRYFPLPADAFPVSSDGDKMLPLSPAERPDSVLTSIPEDKLPLLLFPRDVQPGKKDFGDWLAEDDFYSYIENTPVAPLHSSALFTRESRIGVKLAPGSRAAEQGMLYVAEFIRPCKDVGLYIEFEGYDSWPTKGLLRLGGEGHAAGYREVDDPTWPDPPDPLPARFKVYFITPAYFERGWLPSSWDKFFDNEVELQAVAINGYQSMGGFDYAAHGDKPGLRYVPAGSVYYFSSSGKAGLKSGLSVDIQQNYGPELGHALTELGAEIGFGQVTITNW